MKRMLLLYSCLFYFNFCISQETKETYLIIKLDDSFDPIYNSYFFKINAAPGNPFAGDVYNLVPYNGKKGKTAGNFFFYERNDTTKAFYNYFLNATEALLFLSLNNWKLLTVYSQIVNQKDYKMGRQGNEFFPYGYRYPAETSYPIYYFKKSIP